MRGCGWGPRGPRRWPPSRSSKPPAPSLRASGWWFSRPVIPRIMSEHPSFGRVEKLLTEMVAAGVASAAVGLVAASEEILWEKALGEARDGAPPGPSTRFD